MKFARLIGIPVLILATALAVCARDLHADLFAQAGAPAAAEFVTPRLIAASAANDLLFVLDSGLKRVVALSSTGESVGVWDYDALGVKLDGPLNTDTLLPMPALVSGGRGVHLLNLEPGTMRLKVVALETAGSDRTLLLTPSAARGGLAMDNTGRVIAASLRETGGQLRLVLEREDDTGTMRLLMDKVNPCQGETQNITLTGFAIDPDGRIAVGLAQFSAGKYMYTTSWLLQGAMRDGKAINELAVTHRMDLLKRDTRELDPRYRAAEKLAGQQGYPALPCVPLFTSLAFGDDGAIISGGHAHDPFVRVYSKGGALVRSWGRRGFGGEHVATLPGKQGMRIFIASVAGRRIEEYTQDGRLVGLIGRPCAWSITDPVAIAADAESVYVASRWPGRGGYQLIRFDVMGHYLWTRELVPPEGMSAALPTLCAPTGDSVLVGWRHPNAAGVGYVEVVMADGTNGGALWDTPFTEQRPGPASPSPMVLGADGQLYVVREMPDATHVLAFSRDGNWRRTFPAGISGITMVAPDGSFGWLQADEADGLRIATYAAGGTLTGRKRILRPSTGAIFHPVTLEGPWGWLSSTQSLLRFDETFTVVDEAQVENPAGDRITEIRAVAGDGSNHLYIAVPGAIYSAMVE